MEGKRMMPPDASGWVPPTPDGSPRAGAGTVMVAYTSAIFLAAALGFVVQPMVAKMILPRAGGGPEVWNSCMVFFQAALLAGYAYAHFSVKWLGVRRQAALQVLILLLPFLILPVTLPDLSLPAPGAESIWVLAILGAGVGIPYFVLAATSPLLQRWLAGTSYQEGRDPYFLYAGSNAGSLLGLITYPLVVEPLFPLSVQARLWSFGYAGYDAQALNCAVIAIRATAGDRSIHERLTSTDALHAAGASISWQDRLFWVTGAFIPSSLLFGVTHYLTTHVAPMPLLWVIPLAVYLVTYVLAFARRQVVDTTVASRTVGIFVAVAAFTLLQRIQDPVWLIVTLHVGVLATAGLLCHLRVAERRPAPVHLTEFYLLIAVGGVLGGIFNATLAPYLFDHVLEYPIAVTLACLFRLPSPRGTKQLDPVEERHVRRPRRSDRVLDIALPVGLASLVLAAELFTESNASVPDGVTVLLTGALPTLACVLFSSRPFRFALGIAVLMFFAQSGRLYRGQIRYSERTFFGVYQVTSDPAGRANLLFNGTTVHGAQSTDPGRATEPLAYYHPTGPAGRLMQTLARLPEKKNVAVVGAGVGSLAVLAGPHQRVTLYEIDPAVVRIAQDSRFFTYLANARAEVETVVGDGRLALERSSARFDLIVLDAFSSGAIPTHLLTREALELYLARLEPGGALLFHISNRHLNLGPTLGALARVLGLVAYENVHALEAGEDGIFGSRWVIMAWADADLAPFASDGWYQIRTAPEVKAWTDDFSNVLSVFRWR